MTKVPEGHPSALSGTLRKPFAEQVAFFRNKLGRLVPTARWDDLIGAEHDHAFMVAGAAKADLLADLAAAVDRAIAEGKSLDSFRKDFRAIVERNSWHGWTGEDNAAGRAWRTRTIYRTNAATSYAAGRHAQLVAGNFPLWVYRHGGSENPRIVHLGWNGLVLEPAHAFWRTHYPPSAWGCSCYVVGARSERAARRLGGDPDKRLQAGWDRIDPKTGAPIGIGKNWGYAPGATVSPTVRAMAEKVRQWDHRIAKAFMAEVPEAQRDAVARAYRALPSVADDVRRYARRVLGQSPEAVVQPSWTLGLLTRDQANAIAEAKSGADVALYDWSLDPSAVRHVETQHGNPTTEASRGQRAVAVADYARLPELLNLPGRIEDAGVSKLSGRPLVRIERRIGGERWIAVFELRGRRRTLALETLYIRK